LIVALPKLADVFGSEASFLADGSCRFRDAFEGTERTWPTVAAWASEWLSEKQAGEYEGASEFLEAACDDAVPGVVHALVVLAEQAASADGGADLIGWVGAGPLEDLVSHSGNGLRVLDEVERAARQHAAFRAALSRVLLGADVPQPVMTRLAQLGALGTEPS
jgi:hypothetical protein